MPVSGKDESLKKLGESKHPDPDSLLVSVQAASAEDIQANDAKLFSGWANSKSDVMVIQYFQLVNLITCIHYLTDRTEIRR